MKLIMADLLTVYEAAEFIGITPKAVYLAIAKERIRPIEILNKMGITKTEAERFKKQRKQTSNGKKKAA